MGKKLTLVVLAVLVLVSVTAFVQFGGRTSSPREEKAGSSESSSASISSTHEMTSRSSPSNSTSSTRQSSASTYSSNALAFLRIAFGEAYQTLFATTIVTMNYSIKISQLETTANPINLTLSASSPIQGVSVTISPNELALTGSQGFVTLGISLASTVNSSTLPVEIIASSPGGATNATFDFIQDKGLVVVTPFGGLAPSTLHVEVGQTITWLNLMGKTGGGDPVFAKVALADGSAASPSLGLNDVWSHTFEQPGTYPYQVTFFDGPATTSGVVIVG